MPNKVACTLAQLSSLGLHAWQTIFYLRESKFFLLVSLSFNNLSITFWLLLLTSSLILRGLFFFFKCHPKFQNHLTVSWRLQLWDLVPQSFPACSICGWTPNLLRYSCLKAPKLSNLTSIIHIFISVTSYSLTTFSHWCIFSYWCSSFFYYSLPHPE